MYGHSFTSNPANQPEPTATVIYNVNVDNKTYNYECDNINDAERKYYEIINSCELEFETICIYKVIDGMDYPTKYQTDAAACFIALKKKINEFANTSDAFAWSLLNIKP